MFFFLGEWGFRRVQFMIQFASNWSLGFWSLDPCLVLWWSLICNRRCNLFLSFISSHHTLVSHGIIFQLDENLLTFMFLPKLRTKGYGGNLLETKGLRSAKLSMKTHPPPGLAYCWEWTSNLLTPELNPLVGGQHTIQLVWLWNFKICSLWPLVDVSKRIL